MPSGGCLVTSYLALTVLLAAGVACSVVSIVTHYWVVATASVARGAVSADWSFGIWTYCISGDIPSTFTGCKDIDENILKTSVRTATRVLAIVAPCSCVVVTYLLVILAHTCRRGIVFLPTVFSVAVLQIGCSAAALVLFFLEIKANIDPIIKSVTVPGLVDTGVLPGWSFYVGCAGVGCYVLAFLWLIIVGVAVCVSLRQRVRSDNIGGRYYKPLH